MRMRASAAVAAGALALTTLTTLTALTALTAPAARADDYRGDIKISGVVVNGGKPVVLGTTAKKTFTVSFTVTDGSGVSMAKVLMWHGPSFARMDYAILPNTSYASCTKSGATSVNCRQTFTVGPASNMLNTYAGTWRLTASAQAKDFDYVQKDDLKSFRVQRDSRLTAAAAPKTVKKGATVTVKGKLSRANWDTGRYGGYGSRSVRLQFRKKGGTSYTTVKTIKADAGGNLKTTVKASTSGSYRYTFAGDTTTPAAWATGAYVTVK
ncbi:DUF5707 domain-containing protein [Streptomyces sp. NPDC046203]|uniref:DUF5707 domain-containing protein n=1 Tax=Streptomyces sp. NPDC046203 TaxID=3154602 RepID=UPI0033E788F3